MISLLTGDMFARTEVWIGAVLLAAGVFYLLWKNIPQSTIASLKDATDAGGKVLNLREKETAAVEKQLAEKCKEVAALETDVQRLLREAKAMKDIQAQDDQTIKELRRENAEHLETINQQRREISDLLDRKIHGLDRSGNHGQ